MMVSPRLLLIVLGLVVIFPVRADADLGRSAPNESSVMAVTAECRRTSADLPQGILGISDPHAADPAVAQLIAETGVQWVRAEFHWSRIEPVPGAGYRWGDYDRMVEDYRVRGIRILAILTYIPEPLQRTDWATVDAQFRRFADAAVARYAPRGVHHWEVFNEPNLPGYGWLTDGADVKAGLRGYALLLARANAAVRAHDPRGVVVLGGIASDQHRGLKIERTMDILYGLGAGPCFDVMAFHPYGYQNRFPEARARVDSVLAAHGDRGKPVWFNEYGWTEQAAMDLARNADASTNPMLAALSQRGAADALFWFAAKDYSSRRNAPAFGLATFDLRKRPSFETFRQYVTSSR